ncbi:unnamed protein product [Dibothriocephalus latus]|uniref:Uncharacterized protein n=1 Tax=Dibothriocephalus latus TaxID=60516 RepID=A0A3P7L3N8_DIBLA|nr:unnamed protein product [Dibothriocephalus latus]
MDCLSSEDKRRHDYFIKMIEARSTEFRNTHRILLIGTGESGKSTFVKQLKLLSSPKQTFTEDYRARFIPEIQRNVVQALSNIVSFMVLEDIPFAKNKKKLDGAKKVIIKAYAEVHINPDNINDYTNNPDTAKREEFYDQCAMLWEDEAVKETQLRGNEFQQIDCAQYFLDKLETIRASGYKPTDEDILQCRTKTLGIHTESILYNNVPFELVDVGGQREQRAKWIEAMTDGVTAVIFLTDVSAWDRMLEEDNTVNRLREAYHLFRQVWTKSLLRDKSFILFLNKQDKLSEKIRSERNPISKFFPEYEEQKFNFTVELLSELKASKEKKNKDDNEIWDKHFSYFLPPKDDGADWKDEDKNPMDTQVMVEYGQIQSIVSKAMNDGGFNNWVLTGEDQEAVIKNLLEREDFLNLNERLFAVPLFRIVATTHFIKMLFLNECEQSKTRRIYPYPTTAIDKRNVGRVFESCKEILQGKALTEIMI